MTNHHLKPIVFIAALVLAVMTGSFFLIAKPPSPPPPLPSLAVTPAANPGSASTPTITWNPASVTDSLFLGTVKSRTVTFTSETNLTNISIVVVPELSPYLSVSPDHFESLAANTTATITIFYAATPNQSTGTFNGTIRVTSGMATLARPLPVTLTIAKDTTPPVLSITSPADNSTVGSSAIIVTGTVHDETPVAVIVNGIPAVVDGTNFVANEVPLIGSLAEVAVDATDTAGNTATQAIHVTNPAVVKPINIDVSASSGVAPLEAHFDAHPFLPSTLKSIKIDFEGDGIFDFSTNEPLEGVAHTYINEGTYIATIVAEDDLGNTVTDSVPIVVHPMPPLREMWSGMRSALIRGDIEGALSYFAPAVRDRYRRQFTALNGQLIQLAQQMPDGNGIQFESLRDGIAKFRLTHEVMVDGNPQIVLQRITFIVSEVGQWRIATF